MRLDFKEFEISGKLFLGRLGLSSVLYAVAKAKAVFLLPFYTRLLGAEGMGVFTLVTISAMLLRPFMQLNGPYGFVTLSVDKTEDREISGNLTSYTLSSFLFASVSGTLLMLVVVGFFPSFTVYAALTLFLVFSQILREVASVVPTTYQKNVIYSSAETSAEIAGAVVSVVLVLMGFGVAGAVMGVGIGNVLSGVFFLFLTYYNIGFWKPRIDWGFVRSAILLVLPLNVVLVLNFLVDNADRYILSYFHGVGETGVYSASLTLVAVAQLMQGMLSAVYTTTLMKFWRDGQLERFNRYVGTVTRWGISALIVLTATIIMLSRELAGLVLGEGFEGAELIINVAAPIAVFILLSYLVESVFYAVKRADLVMKTYIGMAVLDLLLNALLTVPFGSTGAVTARLLTFVVKSGILVFLAYRVLKIYFFKDDIPRLAAVAVVAAAATVILRPVGMQYGPAVKAAMLGVLWLTCGAAILLAGIVRRQEVELFRSVLDSALRRFR